MNLVTLTLGEYLMFMCALIVVFILYMLIRTFFFSKKPKITQIEEEGSSSEEDPGKEYNLEELKQFNGKSSQGKIFISVKGKVYDVTSQALYGIGGDYNVFSGNDASWNLAKGTLDPKTLNKFLKEDFDKLSGNDKETLDEWAQRFELKYNCIGWLKEYKDIHKDADSITFDLKLEKQPEDKKND